MVEPISTPDPNPGEWHSISEMESLLEDITQNASGTCYERNGKRYVTDWGYGLEAIGHFLDMLR